jgi:hypothetical protein
MATAFDDVIMRQSVASQAACKLSAQNAKSLVPNTKLPSRRSWADLSIDPSDEEEYEEETDFMTNSVVAHVTANRLRDHVPLYRQQGQSPCSSRSSSPSAHVAITIPSASAQLLGADAADAASAIQPAQKQHFVPAIQVPITEDPVSALLKGLLEAAKVDA